MLDHKAAAKSTKSDPSNMCVADASSEDLVA